jgi:Malonate decarboxylase, alpha subunit, transporter
LAHLDASPRSSLPARFLQEALNPWKCITAALCGGDGRRIAFVNGDRNFERRDNYNTMADQTINPPSDGDVRTVIRRAQAEQTLEPVSRSWTTRRDEKRRRMQLVRPWMKGPVLPREKIVDALETLIVSGDRIVLEGDNQKQADFLSGALVKVDPKKIHDLHLIISSIQPAGTAHFI